MIDRPSIIISKSLIISSSVHRRGDLNSLFTRLPHNLHAPKCIIHKLRNTRNPNPGQHSIFRASLFKTHCHEFYRRGKSRDSWHFLAAIFARQGH